LAYIIIFLAVAAVLGPLLAVWPSKRQQALASYRDAARQAGVAVSLREPDGIPPRLQRVTDDPLVSYALRLPPRAAQRVVRDLYVRTPDGWESRGSAAIPDAIAALPDSAEVVVIGWDDIRVYWSERGGNAALEAVLGCLFSLHPGATDPRRMESDNLSKS